MHFFILSAVPEECSQPSLALPENPAHQLGGSNTTPMVSKQGLDLFTGTNFLRNSFRFPQ